MITSLYIAFPVFVAALLILFKAGDWFVTGAVGLSVRLRLPRILIGIVVVGFATTLPELLVSLQAALRGEPEIALGNAIGSVIADDALALALAALLVPIVIQHHATFRVAAVFLVVVDLGAYALAADGTLSRIEGLLFVGVLVLYILYALNAAKKGRALIPAEPVKKGSVAGWGKVLLLFLSGFAGVLMASTLIIESATFIAEYFGVPAFVISLTMVAVGTSLPEIATVIAAVRQGEGEVAAGNVIGADILNILWIAGMSAVANPIHVEQKVINFSFPSMILIVITMLVFLRTGWRLARWEGGVLLLMYVVFLILLVALFGLEGATHTWKGLVYGA